MPEHIKRCPRRLRGLGGLVGRSVGLSIDLLSSLPETGVTRATAKQKRKKREKQQVEDTHRQRVEEEDCWKKEETAIDGRRLEEIGLEDLAVDEQCS